MIGDDAVSTFIDNIFNLVATGISNILTVGIEIIFFNMYIAFFIFYILINVLAFILVKKDKEYAKTPDARRVRESTLLTTAFIGGAIGEYYAMYKYKHKTLHRNFLVRCATSNGISFFTFIVLYHHGLFNCINL